MLFCHILPLALLGLPGTVWAIPAATATAVQSTCTGNTASDRSTWCYYSVSTNFYDDGPTTGVTREYWLNIEDGVLAPDGKDRFVQVVNGTMPGPTLEADWGDKVVVHVKNSMATNGTGIHFHGIRQNWTNSNDGVPAVVQCPVAPGDSISYTWKATQYGSTWYHSHFALQAWEGVFGGIVIHGPASANYDYDLGNLFLTDWDHLTVDELYIVSETQGPVTLDTGLINGTNAYPGNNSTGTRFETAFESGSSYLLRVINAAIDTFFEFSIDNHTLEVIANDLVPIEPYTTDVLSIGIGQRYDIIVTANQASVASDFWMRAVPDTTCSNNDNGDDIKGIVHYGSSTGIPTTSAWSSAENNCMGEPLASLIPYVAIDASSSFSVSNDSSVYVSKDSSDNDYFKWYLGSETFHMLWGSPTISDVLDGSTKYGSEANVITLDTPNEWMLLIIETTTPVAHPIHIHGHDFNILAVGTGTYASSNASLLTNNPPRRDVSMLPGSGYLVLAFKADNPGIWLAHCHIGWHVEEGLALQFVERYSEIAGLFNSTEVDSTCSAWNAYQSGAAIVQDDSGV